MDHAVHRNDARAALRGFHRRVPGWAPRRGVVGCGFAFYSLLARHFYEVSKRVPLNAASDLRKKAEGKSSRLPLRWALNSCSSSLLSEEKTRSCSGCSSVTSCSSQERKRISARWNNMAQKNAPGAQSSQCTAIKRRNGNFTNITEIVYITIHVRFTLNALIRISDFFLQQP